MDADSELSLATRLGWVSFLNDCASEVLARALPLFLTAGLGATPTFVGVVEGLAEAVAILLRGFSGWLSDRMASRKPLVFAGYLCSVLGRVALLFVNVPLFLGAARVFDRTGKGLRSAPRDAMVADGAASGRAGREFGITRFLDTLGALTGIGVALAAGLGNTTMSSELFRSLVLLALPPSLLTLVFLAFFVPRVSRRTAAKTYISWTVPREIRGYLAIVGIFALGNSSDAFLVLRASELGYSFREILMLLVGFNALATVLALPVGRLSDRFGRVRFLAAGWVVYAGAYAAFGAFTSPASFAAALMVYGAFYGFTEGVEKALLADLLPKEKRGTGYGALQLVLGLSALPASFLTGYLMTAYGSRVALTTCAAFATAGAAALIMWARTQHGHSRKPAKLEDGKTA
jgi:MFS family permease